MNETFYFEVKWYEGPIVLGNVRYETFLTREEALEFYRNKRMEPNTHSFRVTERNDEDDLIDELIMEQIINETEEVYYTGAIYNIENIAEDFEEDKEVVLSKGLKDLILAGLEIDYIPGDIELFATGTKEQFKHFVKTNEYLSEYDWHAYGGNGAMVDELIATESLWVDDNVENAKRHSTNLDNEIKKLEPDLPEEKINKLNENATQYRITLDIADDEYDLNEILDFYLEEIGGALRIEEQLIKRGEWPIVTFQTTNKNELIELLDIYTGGDSEDFLEFIEEV